MANFILRLEGMVNISIHIEGQPETEAWSYDGGSWEGDERLCQVAPILLQYFEDNAPYFTDRGELNADQESYETEIRFVTDTFGCSLEVILDKKIEDN